MILESTIGKTAAITKDISTMECEADTEYGKKVQEQAINMKDSSRITRSKDTAFTLGSVATSTKATIRTI